MNRMRGVVAMVALGACLWEPLIAMAGPRSGGSFGGRGGFRSSSAPSSRSYSTGRSPTRSFGGGTNVIVTPGFGLGWGGASYGYGYGGGGGMLGTLLIFGFLGIGAFMVVRAVRRSQRQVVSGPWGNNDDDQIDATPERAFVYKLQLGLGRSARGIRARLEKFAAEGDTASEAGLASLLQQTSLELMREKDSIRYGTVEANGPMSLTNGETKMNSLALGERSRFAVERVRGADGNVRRSEAAATSSPDALEYVVVTVVVATRTPLPDLKPVTDRESLEAGLGQLGGVPPQGLLGLEVIWTPADADDALTETDLLTSYPTLRGV